MFLLWFYERTHSSSLSLYLSFLPSFLPYLVSSTPSFLIRINPVFFSFLFSFLFFSLFFSLLSSFLFFGPYVPALHSTRLETAPPPLPFLLFSSLLFSSLLVLVSHFFPFWIFWIFWRVFLVGGFFFPLFFFRGGFWVFSFFFLLFFFLFLPFFLPISPPSGPFFPPLRVGRKGE